MAASITDKVTDTRNAARPNSARATGTRSASGISLACDNLAGWPTASKVHFVTYQVNSSSVPIAGSQLDCSGIVSGNSITSFTVIDGTDLGNSVGDYVEMLPTAAWGQDLADVLTSTHNRSGGLKTGITIPSPILTTPTVTSPVFSGTPTGSLSSAILAVPYKFYVYRNAAYSASSTAVIAYDAKVFDTGTNIDVSVNKGRFTAPVAGFYQFSAGISLQFGGSGNLASIAFYVNGASTTGAQGAQQLSTAAQTIQVTASSLLQLSAGDYVEVYNLGAATTATTGRQYTFFNGFWIGQT